VLEDLLRRPIQQSPPARWRRSFASTAAGWASPSGMVDGAARRGVRRGPTSARTERGVSAKHVSTPRPARPTRSAIVERSVGSRSPAAPVPGHRAKRVSFLRVEDAVQPDRCPRLARAPVRPSMAAANLLAPRRAARPARRSARRSCFVGRPKRERAHVRGFGGLPEGPANVAPPPVWRSGSIADRRGPRRRSMPAERRGSSGKRPVVVADPQVGTVAVRASAHPRIEDFGPVVIARARDSSTNVAELRSGGSHVMSKSSPGRTQLAPAVAEHVAPPSGF